MEFSSLLRGTCGTFVARVRSVSCLSCVVFMYYVVCFIFMDCVACTDVGKNHYVFTVCMHNLVCSLVSI